MCGLVAIARAGGLDPAENQWRAERMRDAMAHRGPDDATVECVDDWVILGHRRLSILDLAGSRQPLSSELGDIACVFNGEIYNFKELRAELEALGHRFRTNGDGETIVHAYEAWGDAAAERLEGMFAFVLVDRGRRRLLAARDRFGIKPLFWTERGGVLLIASELKGILSHPDVRRVASRAALTLGSVRGHVPWPFTAFSGVHRLEPGVLLSLERQGITRRRYAPTVRIRPPALTGAAAVEATLNALDSAVRRQLVADVPVGAFLSGGIDSSLVTALMCRHAAGPVHTFSVRIRSGVDESRIAEQTARTLGTRHSTIDVDELRPHDLTELVAMHDEPFAETSTLGVRALSIRARTEVKVVLSGDGGDEIFGGYDSYRWIRNLSESVRWVPAAFRQSVGLRAREALRGHWSGGVRRALRLAALVDLAGGEAQRHVSDFGWASQADANELSAALANEIERVALVCESPASPSRAAMAADRLERLPNAMFTKVDIASMAASLEVRVPFLDDAVVRLAETIDERDLVGRRRGKLVLRRVLDKLVPGGLAWAPKRGFALPLDVWMRRPDASRQLRELFGDHRDRLVALTGVDGLARFTSFERNQSQMSAGAEAIRLLWLAAVAAWADRLGVVDVSDRADELPVIY